LELREDELLSRGVRQPIPSLVSVIGNGADEQQMQGGVHQHVHPKVLGDNPVWTLLWEIEACFRTRGAVKGTSKRV
jgi:hypothetical protein